MRAATKRRCNKQADLKNTTTDVKNTLEVINSRLPDTEEKISDLEYRLVEIYKPNSKKKKFKKTRIV